MVFLYVLSRYVYVVYFRLLVCRYPVDVFISGLNVKAHSQHGDR